MKLHQSLFAAAALCFAVPSLWAGTPNNGTLTPDTPQQALQYTVGPFTASNPTPVPEADTGPRCNATTSPCDSYQLTVTLPAGSNLTTARIRIDWPAGSASDYDLYVYQGEKANLDGTMAADAGAAATQANPEVVTLSLTPGTTTVFTLKVVPFAVTPNEVVTGTISLLAPGGGGGGGAGGEPLSCSVPAGVRP